MTSSALWTGHLKEPSRPVKFAAIAPFNLDSVYLFDYNRDKKAGGVVFAKQLDQRISLG